MDEQVNNNSWQESFNVQEDMSSAKNCPTMCFKCETHTAHIVWRVRCPVPRLHMRACTLDACCVEATAVLRMATCDPINRSFTARLSTLNSTHFLSLSSLSLPPPGAKRNTLRGHGTLLLTYSLILAQWPGAVPRRKLPERYRVLAAVSSVGLPELTSACAPRSMLPACALSSLCSSSCSSPP